MQKVMLLLAALAMLSGCAYNTQYVIATNHSTINGPTTATVEKPATVTTTTTLEGEALGKAIGTAVKTAIVP